VIDLEGLANHRGSAFGSIGLGEQPTTQQFENHLFDELQALTSEKRFWVEDEGSRIGKVVVPTRFIKQIRKAPAIFLDVPQSQRLDILLKEYGSLEPNELAKATENIGKRLGGQNVKDAVTAIATGNMRRAAEITLAYYDQSYIKAADKLPRETTLPLCTESLTENEVLVEALRLADSLDLLRASHAVKRVS